MLGRTVTRLEPAARTNQAPDIMKQLVRTIFEYQFSEMIRQEPSPDPEPQVRKCEPIDEALRSLLGKRYPQHAEKTGSLFGRFSKCSEMRLLRERIRQETYRVIFRHTIEEIEIKAGDAAGANTDDVVEQVREPFLQKLYLLQGGDPVQFRRERKLQSILDRFDRQIQALLDWCVSLLPYHAPALGDQDPHAILVRASRR